MSLSDDIITILFSYSAGYARLRSSLRGEMNPELKMKKEKKALKDNTLRVVLSRLKRRGLVDNKKGTWEITSKGKNFFEQRKAYQQFQQKLEKRRKSKKNMIVAFDVPEERRAQRNWLRRELVMFGFESLQKSVWFGPGPLPKDFIKRLGELDLLSCMKFFKAVSEDVV